jgi:hypothetical protein
VAGGPVESGVFACQRQPVEAAIARGVYGAWKPGPAERELLERIHPTGVCRY